MTLSWALAAGLVIATTLLSHPASAEIRMEQRDGVLYVTNVEAPTRVVATPMARGSAVTRSAEPYRAMIRQVAERYALPPALVESVIRVESDFEPRAVSVKGARGLMQLMPGTAAQLGVRNVFDASQNIDAGVRHLRYLVDRYPGNLPVALAAYNAGVDAVTRHGGVPPFAETQAYVARILRLVKQADAPASANATAAGRGAAAETRTLYRYEAADGRVIYSNLPIERLSSATREMLDAGR
jgi:transglycosylase-like protein with SLT domain